MNVIFDMDGLMFDTEKVFIKAWDCDKYIYIHWTFMKMFLVAFWCHMLMDLGRRVREMTLRRRFEFLKLM